MQQAVVPQSRYKFLNIVVPNPPATHPAIVAQLDNNIYIPATQLPYAAHGAQVTLDREIESWKTAVRVQSVSSNTKDAGTKTPWYEHLLKCKDSESIDYRLHSWFSKRGGAQVKRPVDGEQGKYACMTCTNACRACCIWDSARGEVVMLPLEPRVRQAGMGSGVLPNGQDVRITEADATYWIRENENFTMQYWDHRGVFEVHDKKAVEKAKAGKNAVGAGEELSAETETAGE
ncbi:hypothetical protein LTR85_011347 [Meristemomyces frigidus]|nr:hypothetical protein LTR85_011347 [Meristemomyces frigidus]